MKPEEFFNLVSSRKSEFQILIDDMKKYITTNVNFHQGDLLAHSAWTAFYVSDLFDINSTHNSPLQRLYFEDIVKDFEDERLYIIDVKKILILAAFLHDIGKGGDSVTDYYDKKNHEKTGALYLFNNNYTSTDGTKIDLDRILKDFKVSVLEKDIIICLVAGHWLIGDSMLNGGSNKEEYFVNELIKIIYNFISNTNLNNNISFVALMCMMQLIICVADILASQEYKGNLKSITGFSDIPLEHATHPGIDAYKKFNYDYIISNFVPKVFNLISNGYFLGNNSMTTDDIIDKLINNASSISLEEFREGITTISVNKDYNVDQISDIILEYINLGDFKKVYIIVDSFPSMMDELLEVIEINNGIPDFISYLITISSKQKLIFIINDIIRNYKINYIKELVKVNYKFTPNFLGIAKNVYRKSSDMKSEEIAEDIFNLIKNNYDFSDYYISDKHKIFCESLSSNLDTIPEALQITTLRVLIPFEQILDDTFNPSILDSFPPTKKSIIDISYQKDNYGGGYEHTLDIDKGYQFHNDWIYKSIKYIKGLSYNDMLTLYGYTHNGDELSNKYLIGNNASYIEFINNHIYDGNAGERYSTKFFPLYFQLIELVKTYKRKDLLTVGEDPSFIDNILNSYYEATSYNTLISNLHKFKVGIIKEATKQYIKDLDKIIKNAPPLSHDVILYRGVKDKYYYPISSNKTFINNTFMSTSYTIFNAYEFSEQECCIKKIICKAGTPAIFLECITSHPNENEILLGLNNNFTIVKDELRPDIDNHEKFSEICESIKGKMNVTTMVTGVKTTTLKLF